MNNISMFYFPEEQGTPKWSHASPRIHLSSRTTIAINSGTHTLPFADPSWDMSPHCEPFRIQYLQRTSYRHPLILMVWAEHCPFHQCIEYPSPSPSHPQCFHHIRVLLLCSYYSNPFSPLKLLNKAVVPCWISSWIRDHLGVFFQYDRGRDHQSLCSRTLR